MEKTVFKVGYGPTGAFAKQFIKKIDTMSHDRKDCAVVAGDMTKDVAHLAKLTDIYVSSLKADNRLNQDGQAIARVMDTAIKHSMEIAGKGNTAETIGAMQAALDVMYCVAGSTLSAHPVIMLADYAIAENTHYFFNSLKKEEAEPEKTLRTETTGKQDPVRERLEDARVNGYNLVTMAAIRTIGEELDSEAIQKLTEMNPEYAYGFLTSVDK